MIENHFVNVNEVVVLTNDDGYQSGLFNYFNSYLQTRWDKHTIVAITPSENMSAVSHAISIKGQIELKQLNKNSFIVKGYPADCIIVANQVLLKYKQIGLVISGPNLGTNLGQDVLYSGTIAASREAALLGIPTVAFSVDINTHDEQLEDKLNTFFDRHLEKLVELAYAQRGAIISVNISKEISTDLIETPLSTRHYYPYVFSHRKAEGLVLIQNQGVDMSRCIEGTDWYHLERARSVYTVFEALPRTRIVAPAIGIDDHKKSADNHDDNKIQINTTGKEQ